MQTINNGSFYAVLLFFLFFFSVSSYGRVYLEGRILWEGTRTPVSEITLLMERATSSEKKICIPVNSRGEFHLTLNWNPPVIVFFHVSEPYQIIEEYDKPINLSTHKNFITLRVTKVSKVNTLPVIKVRGNNSPILDSLPPPCQAEIDLLVSRNDKAEKAFNELTEQYHHQVDSYAFLTSELTQTQQSLEAQLDEKNLHIQELSREVENLKKREGRQKLTLSDCHCESFSRQQLKVRFRLDELPNGHPQNKELFKLEVMRTNSQGEPTLLTRDGNSKEWATLFPSKSSKTLQFKALYPELEKEGTTYLVKVYLKGLAHPIHLLHLSNLHENCRKQPLVINQQLYFGEKLLSPTRIQVPQREVTVSLESSYNNRNEVEVFWPGAGTPELGNLRAGVRKTLVLEEESNYIVVVGKDFASGASASMDIVIKAGDKVLKKAKVNLKSGGVKAIQLL